MSAVPIGYTGAHQRVYRTRGKASDHTCSCGRQAFAWAYKHDTPDPDELMTPQGRRYSADPSYYVAMCGSCHNRFDKECITHCPAGHAYAGRNLLLDGGKRKCRECVYARNRERSRRGLNPVAHARKIELQRLRRAAQRAAREQQ